MRRGWTVKQVSYTVGVQVWPFPFYRKYQVIDHNLEDLTGLNRLALHHPDGSMTVIPGLERKKMRLYSDYVHAYNTRKAEIAERDALLAIEEHS